MKHRVFIALPIPTSLKKEIIQWQRQHGDFPVRWIKEKNLHITVIPPWYSDDLKTLKQTVNEMEKPKKMTLSFTDIAFGPTTKNPRLIWIMGVKNTRLMKAKQKFEHVLNRKPEKRMLIPHITIARLLLRHAQDSARQARLLLRHAQDSARQARLLPQQTVPSFQKTKLHWKCTIQTFCLMESHLKKTGAEYQVLKTYRLT